MSLMDEANAALVQATALLLYIKTNYPDVFQEAMDVWEESHGEQT